MQLVASPYRCVLALAVLVASWSSGLSEGAAQAPREALVAPRQAPAAMPAPPGKAREQAHTAAPQQPTVYPQPQPPGASGQQPTFGQPPGAPVGAPRPARGLMIAGISIFVVSYLAAAGIGASLLDADQSPFEEDDSDDGYEGCRTCNDMGNLLFVPILGPFLSMKDADQSNGTLIMLGMAQLVGATLTVGGIVRFKKTTRRYQEAGGYAFVSRDRSLALDVAVSPLMAGPLVKLRF